MVNNVVKELKTDPMFQKLVQPLGETALASLREDLKKNPPSRVIQAWNGYLLDDHEKYKLCTTMNLAFQINDLDFTSRAHAASFLCSSQITRPDLTGEYHKYLIGQKFIFEEKMKFADNTSRPSTKYQIAYKIGEELHISGSTVVKYSIYAAAMNTIFDHNYEFALRVLLGKTKVSHENVVELSRLAPDELKKVSRAVLAENISRLTFSDIRHEVKHAYTQTKAPISRRERKEQNEKINATIRQMPAYDPDSDVNSLCMTIGSWVSSMERVNVNTDFSNISNRAMLELMKQLTILDSTISTIQKSLVERTSR